MDDGVVKLQRSRPGVVLVAASWVATLQLLIHVWDAPYIFRLVLWVGVPFVSGVFVPRLWRRDMFLLAVPVLLATWVSTAPWRGTSDTPPGWHWTKVSFGGAVIIVAVQYLGFALGVGLRELVTTRRSG